MSNQNPLLQQLVSPITIRPEDLKDPESAAKVLRLVVDTMGVAFQRLQNLVNTDPRMSDTRIAHGLYTQQGDVLFDYATLPNPGDVLYAAILGGGRLAVWSAAGTGPPTDPGGGPSVAANGPLLDANHNTDTVAQTVSRGSLIYGNSTPKWDELVKPGSPSVLKNDATDAAWVTIPTRRVWIPAQEWIDETILPVSPDVNGTAPDAYLSRLFDPTDHYYAASCEVPDNWVSGTITAKVHWAVTAVPAAQNWVPHLYYLERVDGDSMTAAGTHITGPTTSANETVNVLKITTIGTFTPGAAGRLLRLTMARLGTSDANDNYTDDINFIGLELSFTPSY